MQWCYSLKVQIAAVLMLQVVLISAMAGFGFYALELRKHDYAILNLSGQLRVISQALTTQSQNYKKVAPRDYQSYARDLKLYHQDLKKYISSYGQIINAFKDRNLSAELIGRDEAITCNWNQQANNQLSKAAVIWSNFESGFEQAIGANDKEPRLEYAAEFIIENGEALQQSSADLSKAFQLMMEAKLDEIRFLNGLTIIVFMAMNAMLLLGFLNKVFRPLDNTRSSFDKVAKGNLQHQINVESKNEIGDLARSFNSLTNQLSTVFQLTDKIHQANNLDESLKVFQQNFQDLLCVDWVGLIHITPQTNCYVLERQYSNSKCAFKENETFASSEEVLRSALESMRPVSIKEISSERKSDLIEKLLECQLNSVIAIPLESVSKDFYVLLLAAKKSSAYEQHLELLENISTQLSHSLDKTIGMEGLVISTIEGLAKLAESRDPETGDHLTRMSLYSAVIAEQMSNELSYSEHINSAYIRDVFRFAPMHDIGKVGIEDSILLKPGKLTAEERIEMEKHPVIGADVLKRCEKQMNDLGHSVFTVGIEIAESHHEKFDGTGYPNQLAGADIPLSARIVAVADVFDALTSKRPYKEAWSIEKALEVMNNDSGKHFDPEVLRALQQSMPKVMKIYEEHRHV